MSIVDFLLFFKILLWVSWVVVGVALVASLYNWFIYEHTELGRINKTLYEVLQSGKVVGYFIMPRFALFVVLTAALASLP